MSQAEKKSWWQEYDAEAEKDRALQLLGAFLVLFVVVLALFLSYHIERDDQGRVYWHLRDGRGATATPTEEPAATPTEEPAEASGAGKQGEEEIPTQGTEGEAAGKDTGEPEPNLAEQYLDWLFASLLGVLLYAITEIAKHFPKIKDQKAWFRQYTPWNISTVVKGPIFAIVILWVLSNVTVGVGDVTEEAFAGIGIEIGSLPAPILWGTAFILGFYSRMAREQLDLIAKTLFGRAWNLAQGFEVIGPEDGIVLLKGTHTFKTEPKADVVWTATKGTIDAASGVYTAPEDGDGTPVTIRASLRSDPSITEFQQIILRAFKISGETDVTAGNGLNLSIETHTVAESDTKNIEWEVVSPKEGGGAVAPAKGMSVTYTAPSQVPDTEGGKVTVMARLADKQPAQHTVTVKPKEAAEAPEALEIKGETQVTAGGSLKLSVEPQTVSEEDKGKIEWKIASPEQGGGTIQPDKGVEVTYTAPSKIPDTEGGKVKIAASLAGKEPAQHEVVVKPKDS